MSAVPDKASARLRGRAARQNVLPEQRALLARHAADRLLALPELRSPGRELTVLAYAASAEELDPAPAVAALCALEPPARVAYPRVTGPQRLTLHLAPRACDLSPGAFGIPEPAADAPLVEPDEVDIVIVPGVAFDATCQRIGHGGGYYDRLLPLLGRALRVGYAFDGQVLSTVPCDPHDAVLDVLVTPTRTLRASSRPGR